MIFAWDDTNREHIGKHGVNEVEAEEIVRMARPPFPRAMGSEKFMAWHQTLAGRYLQVIFVFKRSEEVAYGSLTPEQWAEIAADEGSRIVRVIHAMEMTDEMKRSFRKHSR